MDKKWKKIQKALKGLLDPNSKRRCRAMEPFIRATFELFIRYLYRYLGNETECEDVLEDVYADIWESPERLRNVTNEKMLLKTVYLYYMRKRLREVYRRLNRHRHLSQKNLDRLVAPGIEGLEKLCQEELRALLKDCLTRLKAQEHRAIELWMAGMSCRGIAADLKTTVGAVKMLKFRAIVKLRRCLLKHCNHDQNPIL